MKPNISVIIPVYNVQKYLSRCLESLYSQRNDTIEIILVNDGSTDESLNICQRYADIHSNTIIIDKENGGLSDARNAGTKAATGDYIYYLDSDDWLAPNAIKTLYDYVIENDCEIVQGGFYYAYDNYLLNDNKYKKPFVWDRHEAMLELIKNDYVKNFAWGKLYRADVVKKHPFPKGRYYEDSYWQHLIVHECKRYGVVPTPLYYYRQRNSGISGEFSLKNLDLLRGYEERLTFVQRMYPEYVKHMVSLLWRMGCSMVEMAKNSKDKKVQIAYENYWIGLNQRYASLIKQNLTFDIQYLTVHFFPVLMPVYIFFNRVAGRIFQQHRFLRKPVNDRI